MEGIDGKGGIDKVKEMYRTNEMNGMEGMVINDKMDEMNRMNRINGMEGMNYCWERFGFFFKMNHSF